MLGVSKWKTMAEIGSLQSLYENCSAPLLSNFLYDLVWGVIFKFVSFIVISTFSNAPYLPFFHYIAHTDVHPPMPFHVSYYLIFFSKALSGLKVKLVVIGFGLRVATSNLDHLQIVEQVGNTEIDMHFTNVWLIVVRWAILVHSLAWRHILPKLIKYILIYVLHQKLKRL